MVANYLLTGMILQVGDFQKRLGLWVFVQQKKHKIAST